MNFRVIIDQQEYKAFSPTLSITVQKSYAKSSNYFLNPEMFLEYSQILILFKCQHAEYQGPLSTRDPFSS